MPRGVYTRTQGTREAIRNAMLGNTPWNKGVLSRAVSSKIELFNQGLPIHCRRHGDHTRWRVYGSNNIRCQLCQLDIQKRDQQKHPLKFLVRWARNRGWPCDLTTEFLEQLLDNQGNCCALTGITFDDTFRPSLDRINPGIGYLRSNVQLVVQEVNRMKTNLPQDRFIELCRLVSSRASQAE